MTANFILRHSYDIACDIGFVAWLKKQTQSLAFRFKYQATLYDFGMPKDAILFKIEQPKTTSFC